MTLNVTNIGGNPQQPGIFAEAFIPDQLIAGGLKLVTLPITMAAALAAIVKRGTVLGVVTIGAVTALAGTNTGNGTLTPDVTTPVLVNGIPGAYKVVWTDATHFTVTDPKGRVLGNGVVGTAFSNLIKFNTAAGGTAWVAGDSFTVTVAAGSGAYKPAVATAVDGSAAPVGISVDDVDTTSAGPNAGAAQTTGMYVMGEFNSNAIIFDASYSIAVLEPLLRPLQIYLKTFVSAADPS